MSRVVPSQVCAFLDEQYPEITKGGVVNYDFTRATGMAAIVRMTQEIPPELMQLSGSAYSKFVLAFETLSRAVAHWQANHNAHPIQVVGPDHALGVLRAALMICPDEAPSPTTAELAFIEETALRASLRTDLSGANSALHNGEWKGATVLAGAIVEALLLWAIKDRGAKGASIPERPHGKPIERWDLSDFIEVAHVMQIIKDRTIAQATLAREFRNLIHPGRAERLGTICNRGTAMAALAAVEFVVSDLS